VSLDRELAMALEACDKAGQRINEVYAHFEPIHDARADIKLSVDVEAQEIILQHLSAAFPADSFCAEEDTPTLTRLNQTHREATRTWVVDPVDGTRGFAKKNGEFSVMVGLIADDRVVLGVVLAPARQQLTYAVRGGGCWKHDGSAGPPRRCRVTSTPDLQQAAVVVSHLKSGSMQERQVRALGTARMLETYSAGLKLAMVARGEADLYFNYYPNFHDWDICAGHILVEEAGGKVTALSGQPVIYGRSGAQQRNGLIASNGVLHDAALERLTR
jgi:3'(2'), 5'-bisphosphate nucleotidase